MDERMVVKATSQFNTNLSDSKLYIAQTHQHFQFI